MRARVAEPDDLEGVIDCALQFEAYTPTPENVVMLFEMASACGGMFVAVDGARVIGFLCALLLPHPFTGRPYVNVVAWWVPPDNRATGAGLGLLREMLRWVSTQQLDMVRMATPPGSRFGALLQRAGFKPAETGWIRGIEWP